MGIKPGSSPGDKSDGFPRNADARQQQDARAKRLAEALKTNLRKRKAQARGRKDGGAGDA